MKIQELAIIFIIIILPISLLLSAYTQFQINTINLQTQYDSKLTKATYDAIKAFQLNMANSTTSDLANSKLRDLEASVNSFRNSLKSSFSLNGYSEEELNNYIPALVYTLYDGFYIYSPYENTNYRYDEAGNKTDDNGEMMYGLKPYISYSVRYSKSYIDVVITYSLDNYITIQGYLNGDYINRGGYLIDGITYDEGSGKVTYNGIEIKGEILSENVAGVGRPLKYLKENGTKYYLYEDYLQQEDGSKKDCIIYILNGNIKVQYVEGTPKFDEYYNKIMNNDSAIQYYIKAYEFTKLFKNTVLKNLQYSDAIDEVIDKNGQTNRTQIFNGDTRNIFEFKETTGKNIENELSNFNQHRLAIIRHKIETNLAIAISNYNEYSGAVDNVFQMPEIKEDEWEQITNNITLISFLQGMNIGGKIYNGYTFVTNTETKEVVLEENIHILGNDGYYHKIGATYLEDGNNINSDEYAKSEDIYTSAGRINLDFERQSVIVGEAYYYYYPLKNYNASYTSIVMQDQVTTYDDIYEYVNGQSNQLKEAFYTALGRERASKYMGNIIQDQTYRITYYDAEQEKNVASPQIVGDGQITTVSQETPTRPGYIFKGWTTVEGTTTVEYYGGDTYPKTGLITGNVILYPVWDTNTNSYTLTYNANGGSGAPGTQTWQSGNSIKISSTKPIREGYTFKGWSKDQNLIITSYQPEEEVNFSDQDITLYAVWEAKTYTVTYNANGGGGAPSNQTKYYGITLTLSSKVPTRTGYSFVGWNTYSTATSKIYSPGGTYTPNSSVTLYAVWKKVSVTSVSITQGTEKWIPKTTYGSVSNYTILSVIVTPSNVLNKNVTWSSSNTSVATVNSTGKVTAVGAGKTTITATSSDNSSVKDTIDIYVYNAVYDWTSARDIYKRKDDASLELASEKFPVGIDYLILDNTWNGEEDNFSYYSIRYSKNNSKFNVKYDSLGKIINKYYFKTNFKNGKNLCKTYFQVIEDGKDVDLRR